MSNWFTVHAARGETPATIYIYDYIGAFGVTAKDFAAELKALGDMKGKPLNLRLNTPGGDVFQGTAIMTLLRESGAIITAYVDGLAASMGSVIAMVASKVIMAEGSQMMIHNPAGGVLGESADMRSMADLLDSIKASMISAYASKSGQSKEAIAKIMDEETWYDAEEAVIAGFADEVGAAIKVAAHDTSRFKHPPHPEADNKGDAPMALAKEDIDAIVNGTATAVATAIATALKPAPKSADEVVAKTPAELKAEVKEEMKAYAAEVTSLADLAGVPEAAAALIAAETPLAEVRTKLVALKAAKVKGPANRADRLPNNHANVDASGAEQEEDISDLVPTPITARDAWSKFNTSAKANANGVRH